MYVCVGVWACVCVCEAHALGWHSVTLKEASVELGVAGRLCFLYQGFM